MENAKRVQNVTQLSRLGHWMALERAFQRSLKLSEIWRMAPIWLNFAMRSMYYLLPSAVIVLRSRLMKQVVLIELSVPWKSRIEE